MKQQSLPERGYDQASPAEGRGAQWSSELSMVVSSKGRSGGHAKIGRVALSRDLHLGKWEAAPRRSQNSLGGAHIKGC